jgi:hypothetical protein
VKRCPSCNKTYDDETLSFCLEDGSPLIRESPGRDDSQETLVSPSPSVRSTQHLTGSPPMQVDDHLSGKATVNLSEFNAPTSPTYPPPPKPRGSWPWVIAILALGLMMIAGAVIAAIVIPPMLRKSVDDKRAQPTPARPQATATPAPKPASVENADDPPDDEDEVLAQLTKLEEEWSQANIKGDKAALERILADEYVGGPTTHSKREYIDGLTPDTETRSSELTDLTVDQDGHYATVEGTLTEEKTKGAEVYNFEDKFVWRDHRWQAVASKTIQVK